jgi:uncharacterized membrane protein YfcA
LPELNPISLTIIVIVSLIAGMAKVAFGIGAGVFLTPILALVLPPKVAVALMAPMMVITDFAALRHHWGKWHTRYVLVLLPTALVGIALGTFFLAWAPAPVVRKAIGVIALLFVALQLLRGRPGGASTPLPVWAGSIIGLVAGIASAIAHSGGIVMSIYLLSIGLTKEVFVASVVGSFSITDLLKLSLYWQVGVLTLGILLAGIALTPVMLLGGRFGMSVSRRLSVQQFTAAVTVLVGVSGVLLLAT